MRQQPEQLSLAIVPPAAGRPAGARQEKKRGPAPAPAAQLELPLARQRPGIALIEGGGTGSGHRRARLVALDGSANPSARPLPTRDEITAAILGGLADLVAGRISAVGASAIREAAEDALRQLEAAERDPHRAPQFARAARALRELL